MDKRLTEIFRLITPGIGVIDVGTDHGYIPLALAQSDYPGNIIASDINAGPLDAARRTASVHGYENRISFTLCPGLDKCDPESVDTVIIAGMGGDMICGILDKAEWVMSSRYHLILQPMTRVEILRYWLSYNGFEHSSSYVCDGRFDYQVISARYTGKNAAVSDSELYTGSLDDLLQYNNASRLIAVQLSRLRKELNGLEASSSCPPEKAAFMREIVRELENTERQINEKNNRDL